MSALTASPILEPTAHLTDRPQLVLVPTGSDAVGFTRVAPGVRLTRRGRVVMALLALVLLLAAGLGATAAFAGAAAPSHTITVVTGQTLSEIAAAQLPDLALSDAIVEIQLANSLSTDQVHAGQTLTIPAG